MFFSFIIGLSQGLQPIVSFNYGAKQFVRVRRAYLLTVRIGFCISAAAFFVFQIFPEPIIGLFGNGSPEYVAFAARYFRIFLFFTFLNFVQPITANTFTAIGKPKKGMFLSLTRQILFLLPLLVALPLVMGIDGILYAGPVADALAVAVSVVFIWRELAQEKYKG